MEKFQFVNYIGLTMSIGLMLMLLFRVNKIESERAEERKAEEIEEESHSQN